MSENIWNVMTPFADVAELGQGYMGRADGERLWVPLSQPAALEEDIAFVIYLLDGTPAFAGSGRCIQVADQGEDVDPQIRFEALLDTLAFDERSQPVYDYIVAVRGAAEEAQAEDGYDYAEDEAPSEDLMAADAEADGTPVRVDDTDLYAAEDAAPQFEAEVALDSYGQAEDFDDVPLADPLSAADGEPWAGGEHGEQAFAEHASAGKRGQAARVDDTALMAPESAPAWDLSGEASDAYGDEFSEVPIHTASDSPDANLGEGFTDPGYTEPVLLGDPYNSEATAPGGSGRTGLSTNQGGYDLEAAFGEDVDLDHPIQPGYDPAETGVEKPESDDAYRQQGYDQGAYDQASFAQPQPRAELQHMVEEVSLESYGAAGQSVEDGLELPAAIAERVGPSARPAEAAVETVMMPSIMPIATGILSRPAIALHFQPVRARGPARSAATGLFEYAQGELPRPAQLPRPAGF